MLIHLDLVKYLITLALFHKENDPVIDRWDYKVCISVKVKLLITNIMVMPYMFPRVYIEFT